MKVECAWCGKVFERSIRQVRNAISRGSVQVCSFKCRGAYSAAKRQGLGPTIVISQCPVCGTGTECTLEQYNQARRRGRPKFCSRSCAQRYSHGRRYAGEIIEPRLIPNYKPYPEVK